MTAPPANGEPRVAGRAGRGNILLVEDEEAHAELICRAFRKKDPSVTITRAGSLAEARRAIRREAPAMALIDLLLPDGRGTDLLESLPSPPPFPVVIMTSHGDEKVAVESIKAGALDYRVKSEASFAEMPHTVATALREWAIMQERNRAVEALRRSEERFRALTENTTDITLILDGMGRLRYVSPSAGGFGGYARAELLSRHPRAFVHPEDLPRLIRTVEGIRSRPGEGHHVDSFRMIHKNGDHLYLEGLFVNMPGVPGVDGLVVNLRDISERKKMERELERNRENLEDLVRQRTEELYRSEEKLRQAERLASVGTLAAGIAHEINNPIGAILLYAQTALRLQNDPSASGKSREALGEIVEQCRRCDRIIKSLLQFSREGTAEMWETDVPAVARRALKNLNKEAEARGVSLELREGGALPAIIADGTAIEQVFVNLVRNAIQASRDGCRVRVTLGKNGSRMEIAVADEGRGIPGEKLGRIFDPFSTDRENEGGTGLGLSIVHGVVESHGGSIDVESEPGRGSTFRITLPLPGADGGGAEHDDAEEADGGE